MVLVKSLMIRGSTDFGKAKAELADVAARARKVGEISPTIDLKVDNGAALLKLKAFSMELRALKDSGSQAGLSDLAARLKSFGNEATTSRTKMAALKLETDALKASMGGGGGRGGGLAGAAGEAEAGLAGMSGSGGMGAAVGAGVALSPILLTVGTGLAGIGAAAAGTIMPIEKAASKTGGLKANLGKLDAEQRIVAKSILGLGTEYSAFQKALEPEVIGIFNQGIRIAGHLMTDVQPVAAATGKAFDSFLGQVDRTFQSGEWQRFFTWMAANAGPDMRLLGDDITGLLKVIPPVVQAFDPLGKVILSTGRDIQWFEDHVPLSTKNTLGLAHAIDKWTVSVTNHLPGGRWLNDQVSGLQPKTVAATTAMTHASSASRTLSERLATVAAGVTAVMTAENKSLTTLNTYAGDLVTTANDAASLRAALKASHDQIGLHTAAQRNSFAAANTYITDLGNTATAAYSSGHGVNAAIKAIKDGLPILDKAKTKNRAYWEEVRTLKQWLDKLRAERNIRELVIVTGSGSWTMHNPKGQSLPGGFPGGVGAASGWRVPGFGGGDRWPAMLEGGEAVIDKHRTAMLAPLFRSLGVPGFAAGGIAGSYGGALAGLGPWAARDNRAAISQIGGDIARAMAAAVRAAVAGAAGGGALGGGVAANLALGRRMFPWPAYMWPSQQWLWNRESGWNRFAYNASSGATGIPQALPYTKMPRAAWLPSQGGQASASAQIGWGYGYERGRYGNPLAAAAHETLFGWYDRGGYLPPGLSLALNTTGRPERVGGGNNYHITVHVPPLGRPADVGRETVAAIKAFEKGSGNSWRK